IFPNAGEVLALSAFYKRFRNPIVTTFRLADDQQFTWTNSESASLYGLEVEARKSLGFVSSKLENFTISTNLSVIESKQLIDEQEYEINLREDPTASQERPFNGQSPLVVNANLSYTAPNSGWDAMVAFNYFGNRLQGIGAANSPDVYERGRGQLDVSLSKKIQNFTLSLRARNLLDPAFESYSTFDREYIFQSYERGREFSFGISYGI
ncbi:MAG: TonB-dependent receptor, partial [Lewinella sp.]